MNKLAKTISIVLVLVSFSLFGGCKSAGGNTMQEKRDSVMQMRTDTMAEMRRQNPAIDAKVKSAPGYAVFSNYGFKIFVVGSGNGYGVSHDNKSGADTYMRMGELNVGLGWGAKDFRLLFIFKTEKAMHDFVNKGWDVSGDAEAGAKLKNEGAQAGAGVTIGDIEIYQFTTTGATLSATVGGTKYWKDKDLNAAP